MRTKEIIIDLAKNKEIPNKAAKIAGAASLLAFLATGIWFLVEGSKENPSIDRHTKEVWMTAIAENYNCTVYEFAKFLSESTYDCVNNTAFYRETLKEAINQNLTAASKLIPIQVAGIVMLGSSVLSASGTGFLVASAIYFLTSLMQKVILHVNEALEQTVPESFVKLDDLENDDRHDEFIDAEAPVSVITNIATDNITDDQNQLFAAQQLGSEQRAPVNDERPIPARAHTV